MGYLTSLIEKVTCQIIEFMYHIFFYMTLINHMQFGMLLFFSEMSNSTTVYDCLVFL